ncbi:hypothetical protein E4U56_002505 [Claviceps arundinis]|uniref:Uncharacterized protein n=1 Tax=Claviceps arundinis TaxID=1623583 RepID=A0A9P7MR99_9HYPO|nr:hypothetical protein E4U56_002505 [Claviceps arundinis]
MAVEGHATFLSDWLSATNELMDDVKTHFKVHTKRLREQTNVGQKDHASLAKRKPTKQIEDETEKARLTTERSDTAWTKAEKFFLTCDREAAYHLCLALDLRDKMEWFHGKWDQYPESRHKV